MPFLRRGSVTRTRDRLVPNQERYQLRYTPENELLVSRLSKKGRGSVTRTRDRLVPNQERYQLRYTPSLGKEMSQSKKRCKITHFLVNNKGFCQKS